MDIKNEYIKRICSFYAGGCHLVTMILPYLNKKIKQEANLEFLLDNDTRRYLQKLLDSVNLEKDVKDKIKKINWNNNKEIEEDTQKILISKLETNKENIFFIDEEYYDISNKIFNNLIETKLDYLIENDIKIKLIYCYNIQNLKNIEHILSKYEHVLNTSGIHEIKEVFQCNKNKIYMNTENKTIDNKCVG